MVEVRILRKAFLNNCYLPTNSTCFIRCIKYLTGKHVTEKVLNSIPDEKRRSNIMTLARIQPFCRKT